MTCALVGKLANTEHFGLECASDIVKQVGQGCVIGTFPCPPRGSDQTQVDDSTADNSLDFCFDIVLLARSKHIELENQSAIPERKVTFAKCL